MVGQLADLQLRLSNELGNAARRHLFPLPAVEDCGYHPVMSEKIHLLIEQCEAVCREAALRAGASEAAATALARASVAADAEGNHAVGMAHLSLYLDALREGRIDGKAVPEIGRPLPAVVHVDARGGTAHLGFDLAYEKLVEAARSFGIAVFAQKNAFTCGSLGYFVQRLAEDGLVALAATNGPRLMTVSGAREPVYCTNPLAFAAPMPDGDMLLIDQATSPTAFAKVRSAAGRGEEIPEGWAVDAEGRPTTSAAEAVKGALVAFGGSRGANIALMVEILAAGLTGANWSLDAPSISEGDRSPRTGLFVIAIEPSAFGQDFPERLRTHAGRLAAKGVHVPGRTKAAARLRARQEGLSVPRHLFEKIEAWGRS